MSTLLAPVLGVATHLVYFHRGEHHFYGVKYLQVALVACATAIGVQVRLGDQAFKAATASTLTFFGLFLAGLFSSLFVYRLFLHPLNKFPGPYGARLANLWYTTNIAGNAQAPKVMLKLHEKYGDFVRIGSSDLSIVHPDGPNIVYGLGTKCNKNSWYDQDYPLSSMHTTRSRKVHDQRRRVWSPAFSDKALRGYEDRVKPYSDKLVEQLKAFSGKPVNVAKWLNYFSFDVMGDLAFGEDFEMLAKGQEHWAIKLLNEGMEPMHLMLSPWIFRVLTAIPGLSAGYWKFIFYCSEKLDRRMKKDSKVDTPDIMSSLLEPYRKTQWPEGKELTYLQADSRLIIVAGSDTTAATLTHVFYHLSKDPSAVDKLRTEIKPYADASGHCNNRDIQDLPYINGVINEALRLNPPVPTAIQRLTPPEGITIGETFIPGNMTVWCPQYVLGRKANIYPDPYDFKPERWAPGSDMVKNKTAFAPFSAGVFGCIGRPLALLELRTIIAMLVSQFDVAMAPGEDGSNLMEKTRDHFTLGLGELNLTFKQRA